MISRAISPPSVPEGLKIAVIGAGISGLGAAWLLGQRHAVTLYEADSRVGGHTNTVEVEVADARGRPTHLAVDTGFIVFNDRNYPNLNALFAHQGVAWHNSNMTFSVSVGDGALEYAGNGPGNIFAQTGNLVRPAFWRLLGSIARFYRETGRLDTRTLPNDLTLGQYLDQNGYPESFVCGHLLPMVAAIWSCPAETARDHPFRSFLAFAQNHGLVQFRDRPQWRTVTGGSRRYIEALLPSIPTVRVNTPVHMIERDTAGVRIYADGQSERFDAVVLACHADQALAMLKTPSAAEQALLGAFRYTRNEAWLHTDPALMPRRRRAWAAWNYLEHSGPAGAGVGATRTAEVTGKGGAPLGSAEGSGNSRLFCSYWMNRLQGIASRDPLIVTLNPSRAPESAQTLYHTTYAHPVFDCATQHAQTELWSLQGRERTWFCGAWFGAGFHEDGLQSGLAVAEALGGVRRPWQVAHENGRIVLPAEALDAARARAAALQPAAA